VAEAERAGDARNACMQRVSLAYGKMELGQYVGATVELEAALVEARRMGLRSVAAAALQNLGWALGRLDRLDEAIASEEEAVREFRAQRDRRMEGGSREYLALLADRAGDLDRAEAEACRAVELLQPFGPMLPFAKATLASVLRDRGRTGDASAVASEAMDALAQYGAEEGEAFTRLVHAELLHARGDSEACAAIAAARDRLLERAAKISSADARESFLARVPEHARTVALAGAWLRHA
jgi:tetratricopeptide (TPR) repeat protein